MFYCWQRDIKFVCLFAEPSSLSPTEMEVGVETLMERMKTLSERSQEFSDEERNKRFEHVETQSAELSAALQLKAPPVKPDISHFVDDPGFTYQDFARRGESSEIPTFRVQVSTKKKKRKKKEKEGRKTKS